MCMFIIMVLGLLFLERKKSVSAGPPFNCTLSVEVKSTNLTLECCSGDRITAISPYTALCVLFWVGILRDPIDFSRETVLHLMRYLLHKQSTCLSVSLSLSPELCFHSRMGSCYCRGAASSLSWIPNARNSIHSAPEIRLDKPYAPHGLQSHGLAMPREQIYNMQGNRKILCCAAPQVRVPQTEKYCGRKSLALLRNSILVFGFVSVNIIRLAETSSKFILE